jgi:hypothetical protein
MKVLIIIKHSNGYANSSAQVSITSQVLEFDSSSVADHAVACLKEEYKQYVGLSIYASKIEGVV